MTKKLNIKSFLWFGFGLTGLLLIGGNTNTVFAQKDPFAKPLVKVVKPPTPKVPGTTSAPVDPNKAVIAKKPAKPVPPPVTAEKVPPIEDRIAFYKKLREEAASKGLPLPKPTVVMSVDELAVNGVFHNSKGFSAIVEATPIKLSYTVYPGEKFFDGQLVAIEENRLVFRRITKMSNGRTVAAEENKPLRVYTTQETVQGTAPVEQTAKVDQKSQSPTTQPATQPQQPIAATTDVVKTPASNGPIVSPLEQWEKQGKEPEIVKDAKSNNSKDLKSSTVKKPVKVSGKKSVTTKNKSTKKPAERIAQANK